MPVAIRVLIGALQQLGGMILGGGKGYDDAKITQALNDTFYTLLNLDGLFAFVLERGLQNWVNARGAAVNSILQLGGSLAEHQIVIRHMYNTVIPNSINHAIGKYHAGTIGPIVQRLAADERRARSTASQVSTLNVWRRFNIDPYMRWVVQFSTKDWPSIAPFINVLIDWVAHPANFGKWAAPPMAGALVNYWADPSHSDTKDAIMLIVTRAMQDAPMDVQLAFEQWLVTEAG